MILWKGSTLFQIHAGNCALPHAGLASLQLRRWRVCFLRSDTAFRRFQGVLNPSLDGRCCCWMLPLLNTASFMWFMPRDPQGCRACWFLKNEKQNALNIPDSQGFACFIFIRLPRRQSCVFGKQQCLVVKFLWQQLRCFI